jgi:hypothetical protein
LLLKEQKQKKNDISQGNVLFSKEELERLDGERQKDLAERSKVFDRLNKEADVLYQNNKKLKENIENQELIECTF